MKIIKVVFSYIKNVFYFLFHRQHSFRKSLYSKQKIKRFIRNNPALRSKKSLDKYYLKACKDYYQKKLNINLNTDWHYTFSTFNGQKELGYIPEYLFFAFIEPTLNDQKLYKAYTDKNALHFHVDKKHLPKTYFHIVNGNYFNENFEMASIEKVVTALKDLNKTVVLKPAIDTGGGKNILIKESQEIATVLQNNLKYNTDSYIIQERIKQHPILEQFHPASVNTIRIMTARVKDKIEVLSSFCRMGNNNSNIDNSIAGGVVCGLTNEGKLRKSGTNMNFITYEQHPDTGIPFRNVEIPGIHEAWEFCKITHKKMLHFTFISWDIAINESNQPICIEYNISNQGIFAHQLNNGPLFGKYTDYFLTKYTQRKEANRQLNNFHYKP